ncbi:NUDIX hydrolase [Rhodovibrio salinarum]|uniref:NUDIX hydrolase n=1 Tax=Rhodovibrio salinarum TaxID=1087 RepID=A0A934QLE9_9PROT|nr:NUDIX hydrolase [Rhodovibrio salinarum]MBK1699046.1 NUDIX hydrolase [Rhodovibrio salinarum]
MTAPDSPFVRKIPQGDDRERLVCGDCGFVYYQNPKIVVGSVVEYDRRILLCRRAIPPCVGYWTLPAGYLELNEGAEAGARREAWEEATADIAIDQLLAVYTIERISQVQLIYRASLTTPDIAAGPESQEVALFDWDALPWSELAFPSVHWALKHFDEVRGHRAFAPRANPPEALDTMPPPAGQSA